MHPQALRAYDGVGFAGKTLRENGGVTYSYTDKGVTITEGGQKTEAVIQLMFGARHQAKTPVLEVNGE